MCGCNKRKRSVAPANVMQASPIYDFASDADFVQVRVKVSGVKVLHTRTMAASAFKQRYGKSNYGAVTNNSVVYMLLADFNSPEKYPTIGLELVLPPDVENVPEPAAIEAPEEKDEKEMAKQVIADLCKVKGVGKKGAEKLVEMGYTTVESLVYLPEYEWLSMFAFNSPENYTEMVESARSLL